MFVDLLIVLHLGADSLIHHWSCNSLGETSAFSYEGKWGNLW